jgi:hypothetical protein
LLAFVVAVHCSVFLWEEVRVLLWQFGIELLEAERRMCNAAEIAFERMQLHEWLITYFEVSSLLCDCLFASDFLSLWLVCLVSE